MIIIRSWLIKNALTKELIRTVDMFDCHRFVGAHIEVNAFFMVHTLANPTLYEYVV